MLPANAMGLETSLWALDNDLLAAYTYAVSKQRPARYATFAEYLEGEHKTLAEVSAAVKLSVPYLSDLKRGAKTPSLPVALRLAAHCDIPVASLVPDQEAA